MSMHLLMLPDGRILGSGTVAEPAIVRVELTRSVNAGSELTLGTVAAAMLECRAFDEGQLGLAAGDTVTLLRQAGEMQRQLGVFILEKPERLGAMTVKLTGYDPVTRLDRDMKAWLDALDGWPYTLDTFARMVCREAGVQLGEEEIPNGRIPVARFTQAAITGRLLMQWIAQVSGCFVTADSEGVLRFGWYTASDAHVTAGGENFFYRGSLTYGDYTVGAIERLVVRLTDEDVGTAWPADASGNTYVLAGNPILAGLDAGTLDTVGNGLYEKLAALRYRPCRVKVRADSPVLPGQLVTVTDGSGISFTTCVMTRTDGPDGAELECVGSSRRDSPTAASNQTLGTWKGRMLTVEKSVEGLKTTAQGLQGQYSELQQTAGQVSVKVGTDNGTLTTVIDPTSWQASLVDADGSEKSGLRFDFETGRFVFNGTGEFHGANEGDSYIAIDGKKLALYDSSGKAALEVGYQATALSDAAKFAFIKFLSRTTTAPYEGMVMRFYDGLWVGNANVEMDNIGGFVATQDSAGIFIQTFTGNVRVYNATGGWKDVYTGDAVARFG